MDPATAIGVASAAISFLDFTIKLRKVASQVSSSENGATQQNAELEARVNKMKEMTEDVASDQLGPPLKHAVDDSIAVSTELLALLKRIREAKDRRILGTVKAVYLLMKHRGDVSTLQQRLGKCQLSLIQGLTQGNLKRSILHHDFSTTSFQDLDKKAVDILAALRAGEDNQLKLLVRSSESQKLLDDEFSGLQDTIRTSNDHLDSRFDDLVQKIANINQPDVKKAFMDSLFFKEYRYRQESVSEPWTKTFEWFFDLSGNTTAERRVSRPSWHSFPRWLENADSSQQYWLSGKAGSGKSTLMAQVIRNPERTKNHLKLWSGSKPLHILSFFLFRAGSQRQASLTYLLRSLLYQLIVSIPMLQEALMVEHTTASDGRIAEWPIATLKKMLSSALHTADDCHFLVLVDGIDEYESYNELGENHTTTSDIVDYLYEIQQPAHVKLCVSSRPELRITEQHTGFLEVQLARLNRADIESFVYGRLSGFPGLERLDELTGEICHRSNGMFMWAVFAVREIQDGHSMKEAYSDLVRRLDDMGRDLNTAIAHIMGGIAKHHRTRVAFYLQALGSWMSAMQDFRPMTVALMTAFRVSDELHTPEKFMDRCRREEQALRYYTRGLAEVGEKKPLYRPILVRSWPGPGASSPHNDTKICHGEYSWEEAPCNGELGELCSYEWCQVTMIHRSAYEFFADEGRMNLTEASWALVERIDAAELATKVQQGLCKVLWLMPLNEHYSRHEQYFLSGRDRDSLEMRYGEIVRHTATAHFSQQERTTFLDNLVSEMRLELLSYAAKEVSYELREHIPGDIFSEQTLNGRLQSLDEDKLYNLKHVASHEEMRVLAEFEANGFWHECGRYKFLSTHFHDRLTTLAQSPTGRLVLAEMVKPRPRMTAESTDTLLRLIGDWLQQLACRRRPASLFKWAKSWVTGPGLDDSSLRSVVSLFREESTKHFIQWIPSRALGDTDHTEAEIVLSLTMRVGYMVPRDHDIASRLIGLWDVWVAVDLKNYSVLTKEPSDTSHAANQKAVAGQLCTSMLFSSLAAGFAWVATLPSGRYIDEAIEDIDSARDWRYPHVHCQVIRVSIEKNGSVMQLFSHKLDPSIQSIGIVPLLGLAICRGVSYRDAPLLRVHTKIQVDDIVDDIRRSKELSLAQKDIMVEDVRSWPTLEGTGGWLIRSS